jgi:hypothetical protein
MAANISQAAFASVVANTNPKDFNLSPSLDHVIRTISATSPWTVLFTILAMCVAYDQSMLRPLFFLRQRVHRSTLGPPLRLHAMTE